MEYVFTVVEILSSLLFIWLGFCTLYISVLAIAGCFYREPDVVKLQHYFPNILILIPAYKEDAVIIETAKRAVEQRYPNYDVVIIADSLQEETISKLNETGVATVKVSFEKSTKTKAINTTLKTIESTYDLVLVLDADNVMGEDVLMRFAEKFSQGHLAIQGHRTAKNIDSGYAILDAISEEMNNHMYSKGAQMVGLTSRVVGSGMAIEYNLFKKLMSEIEAVGGFDKVLQLKLLESGNMISYLQDAIIFDEKVGSTKVFSNQRKRWTSSQYLYLKMYFSGAFTKLFKGNYNYFMILLIHVFPPRILLPVLLFIPFMIALVFQHHFFSFLWGITFFALVISYTIAAPKKLLLSKQIWVAFKALPSAIYAMMQTVFKLKGADETFIHTPHSSSNVETKMKS